MISACRHVGARAGRRPHPHRLPDRLTPPGPPRPITLISRVRPRFPPVPGKEVTPAGADPAPEGAQPRTSLPSTARHVFWWPCEESEAPAHAYPTEDSRRGATATKPAWAPSAPSVRGPRAVVASLVA